MYLIATSMVTNISSIDKVYFIYGIIQLRNKIHRNKRIVMNAVQGDYKNILSSSFSVDPVYNKADGGSPIMQEKSIIFVNSTQGCLG